MVASHKNIPEACMSITCCYRGIMQPPPPPRVCAYNTATDPEL